MPQKRRNEVIFLFSETSWLNRIKASERFLKLVFAMKTALLLFTVIVLPSWDIVSDYVAAHKHFQCVLKSFISFWLLNVDV